MTSSKRDKVIVAEQQTKNYDETKNERELIISPSVEN